MSENGVGEKKEVCSQEQQKCGNVKKKSIYSHDIRHQISCGGRRENNLFIFGVENSSLFN